jgi:hypothetical protein
VRVTAAHPVACDGRWERAERVRSGERVRTLEGWSRVASVEVRREPARVFDLEVRPCASFFADGVLVHNKRMTARGYHEAPGVEDLVGVWVGWDTRRESPYCRLELRQDGKGTCVIWVPEGGAHVHEVHEWSLAHDQVTVTLIWKGREMRMEGQLYQGLLELKYGGDDGSPWFGPLHLVPEEVAARAAEDVREALAQPRVPR